MNASRPACPGPSTGGWRSRHCPLLATAVAIVAVAWPLGVPAQQLTAGSTEPPVVRAPALYPEGIEVDPRTGTFLLGSIRRGMVVAVAPDGSWRPVVEDDRLRSVIGIRVDAARAAACW